MNAANRSNERVERRGIAVHAAILHRCWSAVVWVLHRHYPPRLFVFYPLYRFLRRRLRLTMALANLLVWAVSAILHGGFLIVCGSPSAGVAFAAIFLFLGVVSSGVVLAVSPVLHRSGDLTHATPFSAKAVAIFPKALGSR